jgi:acetylornithine aminotransferase
MIEPDSQPDAAPAQTGATSLPQGGTASLLQNGASNLAQGGNSGLGNAATDSVPSGTAGPAQSNTEVTERYATVMMNTFGRPKRVFVRGEGVHLWDADGKQYLDLLAGIAVNALGHAHPALLGTISTQLSTLGHVSNFFATPTQVALAEKLARIVTANATASYRDGAVTNTGAPANSGGVVGAVAEPGSGTGDTDGNGGARVCQVDATNGDATNGDAASGDMQRGSASVVGSRYGATEGSANTGSTHARVFFTNSGTEANEAALKITRLTGRKKLVAMEGSFHGRTMGALALTHNAPYREPFEPLPGVVEFVPYGDVAALRAAMDDTVAAVVVEPIQGENGVVEPPDGYLQSVREVTATYGSLLWLDEVQTGMGRTGTWLASEPSDVTADIVTLAKGLAGGFPIGACVATGTAAELLGPGSHGTTFGGNPVAAAAGLAVIGVIERDGLLAHATEVGDHLREAVTGLGHPLVQGIRGRGLLRGIVLTEPIAPALADVALDAGFVVNAPRPNVIRLVPPLVITSAQIDTFVQALPGLLRRAESSRG